MSLTKQAMKNQIHNKMAEAEKKYKEEIKKLSNALEVIESLEEDINLFTREAGNDREEAYNLNTKKTPDTRTGEDKKDGGIKIKLKSSKKFRATLRTKLERILEEADEPLTSRMLMEEYNRKYPNLAYKKFTSFSGSFSPQYRKPNSKIKKYEIVNAPVELSAFYGLKNWFEGDELKEVYKQKISDKHGVK